MGFTRTITASIDSAEHNAERDQDAALIARVQAGEIQAFDALVNRYKVRLFAIIYNLTGNREDTADLLQDTFVKAFQAIGRFKPSAAFFTWIYRIALNTTTSYLRKQKLRRFFSFESVDEEALSPALLQALSDTNSAADKSALVDELQDHLNEALQSLSIKHRTAIVLFEIEGLSHAEIGRIMGCTEGTVRSRVHYAKTALQSLLSPYLR